MLRKILSVSRFRVLLVVTSVLLLALAGLSAFCTSYHWDGGFEQVQYRFTLRDHAGRALEGAELRVTDNTGTPSPGYPISDFLPANPLLSDANGQIVCHHVRLGPEFGGRGYRLFWIIPMGEVAPDFRCQFLLHGQEVGSCVYPRPHRDAHLAEVLAPWDLRRYVREMEEVCGPEQDLVSGEARNLNGTVSLAERAAWNALVDARAIYQNKTQRDLPVIENRRFRIVEVDVLLDTENTPP